MDRILGHAAAGIVGYCLKLSVTSQVIIGSLFEEPRLVVAPILKCSERRSSSQRGLRELAVVEADVAHDRLFQIFA